MISVLEAVGLVAIMAWTLDNSVMAPGGSRRAIWIIAFAIEAALLGFWAFHR
jgi:hypothetical protein